MFQINDVINTTTFSGLSVSKISELSAREILLINLEKNAIFPEHTSPADATLLVLQGEISFFINNSEYKLLKHQLFKFPKNTSHWVEAKQDSKFLIFR